ncbi:unnamed protein product [Blepharisma stoltei]|uniref:EGF-like domain-containing protein n=1 Tax=Blepharisma stoltei TaxID=1481888 RepID=A0AAU9K860_9CILI|nr:unnamed protein product [Blepharisma stoltei]
MLKGTVLWVIMFTFLHLVASSSQFKAKDPIDSLQFTPKRLAEFHQQDLLPLEIHTEVIEKSFADEELIRNLQAVLNASAKIISDLVLTRSSTELLRLGENNRCTDIESSKALKSQNLRADIAIIAVSNKNKGVITSKRCELSDNKILLSAVLRINEKEFKILDESSQVKELSIAISNALFEDREEEKKAMQEEIQNFLDQNVPILRACEANQNNCAECDTNNENCIKCIDTYFLNGEGTCSACNPVCATCENSAGNCLTCSDTTHMTAAPACACPTNGALSGTTCTCNTGFYFSADTVCSACNPACATCENSAGNCLTCSDTTHMTAAPACACPTNGALSGTTCACNTGFYFSADTVCSACNANCATCQTSAGNCLACSDTTHMTAAPQCQCPANGALSGTTCTCNIGFYFSADTVCSACNANCATCENSAGNCLTCSDTTHMTAAPQCQCPANGALSGTTCTCNIGFYFSADTVCSACSTNCATCQTSAGNCLTCSDTTHMTAAPQCQCPANGALSGTTCACNTGFYFSADTVCSACNVNCATCQTSAGNCLACSDTTHMTAAPQCQCPANGALSGTTCACNTGFYFSADTVCSACNANCATCQTSAGNCLACSDTTHMTAAPQCQCPANGALSGTTCTCNIGFYFSADTVCSACSTNCATCQTSAGNCLTCSDTTHMTAAPQCACPTNGSLTGTTCTCNTGFYFSADTVCSACSTNCATCQTSAGNCLTCSDTTHMTAAPQCQCPTNGALSGTTCTCNTGFYFSADTVCSACSTNCATCQTSAGNCLTCSDTTHMTAAPQCQCPTNGALSGTTCTCNTGFYFSADTVCSACSTNCATCQTSAGNCLTCSDTTHMTAAPQCQCPTNGALSGTTCTCNTGFYFSADTVCSACNPACATCENSAGNCLTCSDTTHMTAAPQCQCPTNGALSGTTCTCNTGFYFSADTVCSACNANCATCQTSAGNCLTCSDTIHMTAAPQCQCPANGALSGTTCTCNTGFYFSADTVCSACNTNCATCSGAANNCLTCVDPTHMSATPTCACPTNGSLSGQNCVCNTGYFFSSNTACTACNPSCDSCTGTAANCATCVDPTHMTAAPACACPANGALSGTTCICNSGFYFSANTVCSACTPPCAECTGTPAFCTTCYDADNMVNNAGTCICRDAHATFNTGTNTCVCNTGYWNNAGVCQACEPPCLSCTNSATDCTTCDAGYYESGGNCLPCQAPCATCENSAGNCLSCNDPEDTTLTGGVCACTDQHASYNTQQTTCQCNSGYFGTPGTCAACNTNCATCSGAADSCVSCADSTHMTAAPACACPANSAQTGSNCVCNTGFYFSANTVCSACAPQCTACSGAINTCTQCSDPTHMTAVPECSCPTNGALSGTTCTCKAGYYFSANTVCSACNTNCATCQNNAGNCLTCSDTTHMTAAPQCQCPTNGALSDTTCTCNAGYYFSTNTVCSTCNTNCAACETSAGNCLTCSDATHMTVAPQCACPTNGALSGATCTCNAGYYFSANTVCSACNTNCATCSGAAGTCVTCVDPTHMSAAPQCSCPTNGALSGATCTCNAGYYFSTNTVCSACNTNCATCQNNAGNCLTCSDTIHMSAAPACACPANGSLTETTCTCNTGYFFSSATTCTACASQCATCANSNTNCLTCTDTTHTTAAPACSCPENSALTGGSCVCSPGFYYSTPTVCSACNSPCSECSTSSNTCTNCINGYYLHGNVCTTCTAPCATCSDSPTTCQSCDDSEHMTLNVDGTCTCTDPNASFNTGTATCQCNSGFTSIAGECTACELPCTQCSTSISTCTACVNGFWLNQNTCSACNPPCAQCSTSATTCTVCNDINNMNLNPTTNTCTCKDPNASFVVESKVCICNSGYFNNGGTCDTCQTPCLQCSGTAQTCQSCVAGYYLSGNNCIACDPTCTACSGSSTSCTSCANGYWLSGSTCTACSGQCATCRNSAANCVTCSDPTHMSATPNCSCPTNGALVGAACQCNAGYYYSTNTVCSACDPECATCQTNSATCTACIDPTHMSAAPTCSCPTNGALQGQTCVCNVGYFYSSDTVCSACAPNCNSCVTSLNNCLTCTDSTHMSAAPACACPALSTLVEAACVCNTGYYFSSSTQCSACGTQCATCTVSSNNCATCIDSTHMSSAPTCACPDESTLSNNACVCNEGYFFSSNTVCSPCVNGCKTCNSPASCQACYDPKAAYNSQLNQCICNDEHAYISPSTNMCVCNAGYFSDPNNSGICTSCSEGCKVCTSLANCQTCWDPNMTIDSDGSCSCDDPNSTFNDNQNLCVCNNGYFQNGSTCVACSLGCKTCNSAVECTQCFDTAQQSLINGACLCNGTPAWTYNSATQTCVCSVGYYQNGNTCDQCPAGCVTCTAANNCQTCSDPHSTLKNGICVCNDPNAGFKQNDPNCICNSGFYENVDTCTQCQSGCEVCGSATFCTQCFEANMTNTGKGNCVCSYELQTFNPTTHQCSCPLHTYADEDTQTCQKCDETCSNCQAKNNCLDCYDADNMVNNRNGTCSCIGTSKRFSNSTDTCIDRSSGALELGISWLLLGFVSFFYLI